MFKISTNILSLALLGIRCTAARMFYAVKKGRSPGVYQTWADCKEQVDRFPAARYKKFASEEEAWKFVRDNPEASAIRSEVSSKGTSSSSDVKPSYHAKRPLPSSMSTEQSAPKRTKLIDISSLPPLPGRSFTNMGDSTIVYTDGCCSRNGRTEARAGIGVYWGPNHPLNVAERLEGKQTNQRAEIQIYAGDLEPCIRKVKPQSLEAACKALEQAKSQNISKLVVFTDSMHTINGITKWIHSWKGNNWKMSTGKEVVNRGDFEKLDRLVQGLDVKWMHIPGHAGFGGNEEADRLAREGAQKPAQDISNS